MNVKHKSGRQEGEITADQSSSVRGEPDLASLHAGLSESSVHPLYAHSEVLLGAFLTRLARPVRPDGLSNTHTHTRNQPHKQGKSGHERRCALGFGERDDLFAYLLGAEERRPQVAAVQSNVPSW